jgi:hypothetical protein
MNEKPELRSQRLGLADVIRLIREKRIAAKREQDFCKAWHQTLRLSNDGKQWSYR